MSLREAAAEFDEAIKTPNRGYKKRTFMICDNSIIARVFQPRGGRKAAAGPLLVSGSSHRLRASPAKPGIGLCQQRSTLGEDEDIEGGWEPIDDRVRSLQPLGRVRLSRCRAELGRVTSR